LTVEAFYSGSLATFSPFKASLPGFRKRIEKGFAIAIGARMPEPREIN